MPRAIFTMERADHRLAQKVAELVAGDLNHVFFTLGGSDAVGQRRALYPAYYFQCHRGGPARSTSSRWTRRYHGSTSTGRVSRSGGLSPQISMCPSLRSIIFPRLSLSCGRSDPDAIIAASVTALTEKVTSLGAENVAAFFCEPVQGSGGVLVPPRGWLATMRQACRNLGILFVVDEVITVRTHRSAVCCEHENIDPDIMTVAKG